jgi:hypothetical protein
MTTHAFDDDDYGDEDEERDEFEFEDEDGVDATTLLPRPLKRLIARHSLRDVDFKAATAALLLAFARGISEDCKRRSCREQGICQKPPLACAVRRYADVYDWDRDLENGPRAAMYEALAEKPADAASVVRQHTPGLAADMVGIPLRKKSG